MNQGTQVTSGPAKLIISNLDQGVSDSDIFVSIVIFNRLTGSFNMLVISEESLES